MKYGTLLVIDDNPSILTAVKICLGGTFERVLTLNSPDKALATIAQEHPSVVLLDMNFSLGVNSGQEGMMWLTAIHRRFPDIPIVLITAYADVKLAVRALKNGAADFVTKPWDNDQLNFLLRSVLKAQESLAPLDVVEMEHIRRAVDRADGNLTAAAKMLGLTRQTLYNKLNRRPTPAPSRQEGGSQGNDTQ